MDDRRGPADGTMAMERGGRRPPRSVYRWTVAETGEATELAGHIPPPGATGRGSFGHGRVGQFALPSSGIPVMVPAIDLHNVVDEWRARQKGLNARSSVLA
jgi:hypothetical protein